MTIRKNKKGELRELFKGSFAQCNLLKMKKNTFWGGHYHQKTKEFFYLFRGKIEAVFIPVEFSTLRLIQNKRQTRTYSQNQSFTVSPYTMHNLKIIEPTLCLVLYSHPFNPKDPDLYQAKNI